MTEAQEQAAVFSWAALQMGAVPELGLLFHVPNGGSRHPAEAAMLKRRGVKAGVPDICLPVARGGYHGMFIELKRDRASRISHSQKDWLERLEKEGYMARVCFGAEDAIRTITEYLNGGNNDKTRASRDRADGKRSRIS